MQRALWIVLALLGLAVAATASWAGWFFWFDGRAPARRPELIALPADAPAPPQGYPTENALKLAYLLGRLELLERQGPALPASVEERKDLEYGRIDDCALLLDLYVPKDLHEPASGIIFIHGGGWRNGNRTDYRPYAIPFAERGYVVATISYRFAPKAPFPAALEDTKCAVRWLRANAASLKVHPDRIALVGGSAGGYLALMAGYTAGNPKLEGNGGHSEVSSAVQAVVDLYGPTDFDTDIARNNPTVTDFLGKSFSDDAELFRFASPINHVTAQSLPTFVLHGTIDSTVPVGQSDALVEKLRSLGVPHWYDRLDGWPHTMDLAQPVNERSQRLILEFLEKYLKGK